MSDKKTKTKTQCYYPKCEKDYTGNFKLKINNDRGAGEMEGKFCAKHLGQGLDDALTMIKAYRKGTL